MKIIKHGLELRVHDAGASGDLSRVVARPHPAEVTGAAAEGVDLTNVIAFTRHRPDAAALPPAPLIHVSSGERPVPAPTERHRALRWTALLLISLAAHVCLYLPFGREPTPMTSLGEISMSVELVLGTQTPAGPAPAGLAAQPGPAETPAQALTPVAEPAKPEPETPRTEVLQAEPTPADTPPPVTEPPPPPTEPPAPVEEPPPSDPKPTEPPPAETPPPMTEPPPPPTEPPVPIEEPAPTAPPTQAQRTAPAPEPAREAVTAAPAVQDVQPSPPPPIREVAPPKPSTPTRAKSAPKKPQSTRPRATDKRAAQPRNATPGDRNQSRSGAPAASAASGVGRGRSEANTNYRGIVAAHLARYKQFPPQARDRGNQGSAVVTFALNGGGRVTSVSLSRGTGVVALDQEAVAMVRRASPFPAPPDARGVSFTVPVSFRLQ